MGKYDMHSIGLFEFIEDTLFLSRPSKDNLHNVGSNNSAAIVKCSLEEDGHVRFLVEQIEKRLLSYVI